MANSEPTRVFKTRQTYYKRREKDNDYLKYHRIVMAWARKNYNVSTIELEMMFFLYTEDIFTKTKFKEYSNIMPMDRRKLERMIRQGWIRKWRSEQDKRYALYELTFQAKKLVNSIYRKMNGEENISESPRSNSIMLRTNTRDRIYSIAIKAMNKKITEDAKDRRHPTRRKPVKRSAKK